MIQIKKKNKKDGKKSFSKEVNLFRVEQAKE
jgi:hypothetical protein